MTSRRTGTVQRQIHSALSRQFGLLRQNYHLYRSQLALLVLLSVLSKMMMLPVDPLSVQNLLLTYGEVLLPQIAGWIATGVLLSDPCRELLLSSGRPIWKTMIERVLLIFSTTLAAWGGMLLCTCYVTKRSTALQAVGAQMFWGGAVASLLFISIGVLFALGFHNRVAGGVVMTSSWAALLLFKQSILTSELGQILYPFLTLDMPDSPFWWTNRLVLTTLSLLLLGGAILLTGQEERLLPQGGIGDIG